MLFGGKTPDVPHVTHVQALKIQWITRNRLFRDKNNNNDIYEAVL